MSIVVFCGPTLARSTVQQLLPGVDLRGPAACGDIYRVTRGRPRAIAIIDGYFEHRLSIWHKEILWALSEGIAVYGAASLGALRAAELAAFGMVGIGRVFEQFHAEELEDDDEVAVVHESSERGYAARSVAMVNIRQTLREATQQEVLTPEAEKRLIAELKRCFYPDRDEAKLRAAAERLLPGPAAARFEGWLNARGITDQKRLDAIALLHALRNIPERASGAPKVTIQVEPTDAWVTLRAKIDAEKPQRREGSSHSEVSHAAAPSDGILRLPLELESQDPLFAAQTLTRALERVLALTLARHAGLSVSSDELQAASERFRRARGLLTAEQTSQWLGANHLDLGSFSTLVHDTVLVERLQGAIAEAVHDEVPNVLRLLVS